MNRIAGNRVRIGLSVMLLVSASLVTAQESDPADPKVADLALLREVRLLAERIEPLADDRFDEPPVAVRSPDAILEAGATVRAARLISPDRLAARGRAWAALGLGDEQAPAEIYGWIARDLPGCVVDEERQRLFVGNDLLPETGVEFGDNEDAALLMAAGIRRDEPRLIHCLMHLRQLERRGEPLNATTTDQLLVTAGWSEAEANLVALRYLFINLRISPNTLDGTLDPGEFLGGELLPRGMTRLGGVNAILVRFVYLDAFAELAGRFAANGWRGLDVAMSRSIGTRDLLHAERLSLPVAAFEAPKPPAEGFLLADTDVLGEQGVVAWVSLTTGKDSLGMETGDGWAGDRLYRWERSDGAVTDWDTAWMSPEASEDFLYALKRSLTTRFEGFVPVPLEDGWERLDSPGAIYAWRRDDLRVQLRIVDRGLADKILPAQLPPLDPADQSK